MNWYNATQRAQQVLAAAGQEHQEAMADGKLMLTEFLRGAADVIESNDFDMILREVSPSEMGKDVPSKAFAGINLALPTLTALFAMAREG